MRHSHYQYLIDEQCIVDGCNKKSLNESKYCYLHCETNNDNDEEKIIDAAAENALNLTWIYFILALGTGTVKIGQTKNIKSRMKDLSIANSGELILLGKIKAHQSLERKLHKYFKNDHIRGEWFALTDSMIDFIEIACKRGEIGILEKISTNCN